MWLLWWQRLTRAIGGVMLVLFVASVFTPLWNRVADFMAPDPELSRADAVVVLSACMLEDGTLCDESVRRLLEGVRLFGSALAPRIVFGGCCREAEQRAALAERLGIPRATMLLETRANTTREEAENVRALLSPYGARRILLVSEAVHLRRAALVFERAGFEVQPAPSDRRPAIAAGAGARFALMSRVLQESAALLYYSLAGYV